MTIGRPSTSTRLTIGSSMVRGRSARIFAIWSFTSLSARSMSTEPTLNCTIVEEEPSRDGGNDVPDAVEARDRVLDLLRHLRFEFARRRARLRDQHLDDRNVDIRKARDRHRAEADDAEHHQHREGDDRGNGFADRPCGDVQTHRSLPQPPAVASGIGRTRSPGRRNAAARATTLSPSARRRRGSRPRRRRRCPGVTRRSSTFPSRTT